MANDCNFILIMKEEKKPRSILKKLVMIMGPHLLVGPGPRQKAGTYTLGHMRLRYFILHNVLETF